MQQPPLPSELSEWNDALDCAIASVALATNDDILVIGSANDVRNLLVAVGIGTSPAFSKITTSSNIEVTTYLSRLERSPKFWDVGASYKDAQRTRRTHMKINIFLNRPVQTDDTFTANQEVLIATANVTNKKFLANRYIAKIVLILPHGCSEPTRLTIHNSSTSAVTDTISISAKTICRTFDDLSITQRPQPEVWRRYVAHGLAHQVRWDFGVTISAHELERSWALRVVTDMEQSERSGAQGRAQRYLPRQNVMGELQNLLLRPQMVQTGRLDTASLTSEQAEIIVLCVTMGGGITIGIPGLSSDFVLVRQAIASELTEKQILEASEVLMSIQAHQEGGSVRRPPWCQLSAVIWVLFSIVFSISVGVANFARRDNAFERVTDVTTTAAFLLVSVFGLVKLTSEDDNVIRNTLLGFRILRNVGQVQRYLKGKMQVPFGLALAAANRPLLWLADGNTSYLQHPALGSIAYVDGVRSDDLLPLGMVFGKRMMLDYRLGRSAAVSGHGEGEIRIEGKLQVTDITWQTEVGEKNYRVT